MKRLLCNLLLVWCVTLSCYAQSQVVKGKVLDGDGTPMPGVTISLKSTNQKTTTNVDGNYTIKVVNISTDVLRFTYIGYQPQEVPLSGKLTLNVKMTSASSSLDEVVVTALNISREKKSLGYAIQGVNTNDMTEARAANITDLLDGKVAGLQLTTSGQSDGSTRVLLRGYNSLTGNNQPLWVVDGVPIDNTDSNGQVGSIANLDYGNNAADLNPDDIESIEVLKGPNAAALYGSRAANGAIIVTTKKGKKNSGTGVSFNSNYMAQQVLQFPDFQNIYGEGTNERLNGTLIGTLGQGVVKEGANNSHSWGEPMLGQPILNLLGQLTTYTPHPDNVQSLYQTGGSLTNNVAVSTADNTSSIRFSYTRTDATDVVKQINTQGKNNFQLNASKDFSPLLRIETRVQYLQEDVKNRAYRNEDPNNPLNFYNYALRSIPLTDYIPWKDANGNATFGIGIEDPYWSINENANEDKHNTIIGGVTATLSLFKDLKFRAQESADVLWGNNYTFIQKGSTTDLPGSYSEMQQNNQVWNTEGLFMYNKNIKNFSITANLGGNLRSTNYYNTSATVSALAVHDIKSLTNNAGTLTGTNNIIQSEINSIYGTVSVGYKGYAYIDVTGRNDWSSTLPSANRSFFYPSISGSFVFTDLLKIPASIMSFGKLRASIAQVGNDTSPYNLYSEFNYGGVFNAMPYVTFDQVLKNSDLKPEQTTSIEVGTELHFFNDRLTFDGTLYKSRSVNQILTGAAPAASGYLTQIINAGEIQNKGIELSVTGTPLRTKDFSWNVISNFSANRNMVVSLSPGLSALKLGGALLTSVYAEVGQPIGVLRGENAITDASGKALINPTNAEPYTNTTSYLGSFSPKFLTSFGSDFHYKNFDLSFLVSARIGGQLFSGTYFRANINGVTNESLGGRDAFLFSSIILGETGNEVLTNTTTLYNLPYPDASRPKGSIFPGYFPLLDASGNPVLDSKGNMIAGAPNTKYINPQAYWTFVGGHDEGLITFDASYVKLTQVIFGYDLPQKFLRKTVFKTMRIAATGRDLWTIFQKTPKGIDPESAAFSGNAQGLEMGGALPYATYGLDFKFSL